MMKNDELVGALWSIKEDATYAYMQALEGDESGLAPLGKSIKNLEQVLMQRDRDNAALHNSNQRHGR